MSGGIPKGRWLTPEEAPLGLKCVQMTIPEGEWYEAILRGCIALLFDQGNFEPYGAQSPEDVSRAFLIALVDFWSDCP